MHIEPWPWVTVRSIKILEIIYIGIDKRSPLGTQFGGKTTNGQYFFFKIHFFQDLSPSISMCYSYMQ